MKILKSWCLRLLFISYDNREKNCWQTNKQNVNEFRLIQLIQWIKRIKSSWQWNCDREHIKIQPIQFQITKDIGWEQLLHSHVMQCSYAFKWKSIDSINDYQTTGVYKSSLVLHIWYTLEIVPLFIRTAFNTFSPTMWCLFLSDRTSP